MGWAVGTSRYGWGEGTQSLSLHGFIIQGLLKAQEDGSSLLKTLSSWATAPQVIHVRELQGQVDSGLQACVTVGLKL